MRISDWSSDVCSSDLRVVRGRPPSNERPAAEAEEAEEERAGGEGDREAEHDLDQATEAARRVAESEREASGDNHDHRDDLGDRPLDRLKDGLPGRFPRPRRAGGRSGRGAPPASGNGCRPWRHSATAAGKWGEQAGTDR